MTIRKVVETCLRNHPPDCIFAEGAVDKITAQVEQEYPNGHDLSPASVNAFERAFNEYEIYCPHENIDRRAEFGLQY